RLEQLLCARQVPLLRGQDDTQTIEHDRVLFDLERALEQRDRAIELAVLLGLGGGVEELLRSVVADDALRRTIAGHRQEQRLVLGVLGIERDRQLEVHPRRREVADLAILQGRLVETSRAIGALDDLGWWLEL